MIHVLSPAQIQNMLHALGVQRPTIPRKDWGYRNGFVASVGSDDDAGWADLEQKGLARGRAHYGDDQRVYYVTSAGLDALHDYGHEVTPKMRRACQEGGPR